MRKGTRDMKYLKTEIDEMRPVYLELYGNPGHAVATQTVRQVVLLLH